MSKQAIRYNIKVKRKEKPWDTIKARIDELYLSELYSLKRLVSDKIEELTDVNIECNYCNSNAAIDEDFFCHRCNKLVEFEY